MKKIFKAGRALLDAVKETASDVAEEAKTKVADEISSFVDKNKTNTKERKTMKITEKVPFKADGAIVILEKGANISIAAAIATVACGIEWDEVTTGADFDADVSCILVNTDKSKNEMIYYGKLESDCKSALHTGDNLTGADDAVAGVAVNEDDETIGLNLSTLDTSIEKVVFFANIHKAADKGQNFGTTGTMRARLYDAETAEVFMEADLMEDNATQTSIVIGEFYRKDGAWKYKNMAQGGKQTLQEFADSYKA